MQGADRIYDIVRDCYYISGICSEAVNVSRKYAGYGDMAIRIGHAVITAGTHARGKTCHIFLEDDNDIFEVYGVVSGQRGWTEIYGWLHEGKWVAHIEKLLDDLEARIEAHKQQVILEEEIRRNKQLRELEEKKGRFERLF